jgi:flagellar motor switch protein FliG
MLPNALRKAAILISALDERAAEMLLDQMGPEQAAKVRSALVELEEISTGEEQRVLAEFLQQQGSPALAKALHDESPDVELEISSAAIDTHRLPQQDLAPASPPLELLASAAPATLASILRSEQPQIIAAVITHLAPEQSAGVLENLPPELATETLERMATLEPLAPAVLSDLERELQKRLAAYGPSGRNSDGDKRLSAVIEAMDFRQRERVLLQLSRRNGALVGRLGLAPVSRDLRANEAYRTTAFRYRLQQPTTAEASLSAAATVLAFADLVRLEDRSLEAVFAAAEPAVALLALTGADERLLNRVMRQLPARDAALLRARLENPGPVRLREIEQAQRELATIASRLAREGEIELPASARFAATV